MGVGINVNSSPGDYAHLGRSVTTLKDICGQRINRENLLQMLIANLERAVGQFRAFGIRPWIAAWKRMDQFIGARGTIVVNNRCTDQNRNSGEGSIKKTGCILLQFWKRILLKILILLSVWFVLINRKRIFLKLRYIKIQNQHQI